MRSCQRWDIYLYLASDWSGLWLRIFSHRFKSQKTLNHTPFVFIASFWATVVCALLIIISFSSRVCFVTWKVTLTKRSLVLYMLYLCIYPTLFITPSLLPVLLLQCIRLSLLHYFHRSILWAGTSSLWLRTANSHSDGNRSALIWTICVTNRFLSR